MKNSIFSLIFVLINFNEVLSNDDPCQTNTAVCRATGDPHFQTFDGRKFDFMGKCKYLLVRDKALRRFEVSIVTDYCGRNKATCVKFVTVIVNEVLVQIEKGGKVYLYGLPAVLPYHYSGVSVESLGGKSVRVTWVDGLTVDYNGVHNVYVKLDSEHKEKVDGLCGNFNDVSADDNLKRDGTAAADDIAYGNSWQIGNNCPLVEPEPHPCAGDSVLAKKAERKCSAIQHAPFSKCHGLVDPEEFIKECEYDICACGDDDPMTCVCEAYASYADMCKENGMELTGWIAHFPRCTSAVCRATGDPHFQTFDGRRFDFMGKCQYLLTRARDWQFEINIETDYCGNNKATCVNFVTVIVNVVLIQIERGGKVFVYGLPTTLPFNSHGVLVERLDNSLIVITSNIGLTATYDGKQNVFVSLSPSNKGKVVGLCGNYNGDASDDNIKKDMKPAIDDADYGDSWAWGSSCQKTEPVSDPCKDANSANQHVNNNCSALLYAPFNKCHSRVTPEDFVVECEYDVCACENNPTDCLCAAFHSYVSACQEAGLTLKNWRKETQECNDNPTIK